MVISKELFFWFLCSWFLAHGCSVVFTLGFVVWQIALGKFLKLMLGFHKSWALLWLSSLVRMSSTFARRVSCCISPTARTFDYLPSSPCSSKMAGHISRCGIVKVMPAPSSVCSAGICLPKKKARWSLKTGRIC